MSDNWISVKESLPSHNECVIIGNSETHNVGEARFIQEENDPFWFFVKTDDLYFVANPPPTHWMKLPTI